MKSKASKALLISAKIVLAVVLLTWVLGKAHWRDYVQTGDGQTYAVIAEPELKGQGEEAYEVATGMLWWSDRKTIPVSELETVGGQAGVYKRDGLAAVIGNIRVGILIVAAIANLLCLIITAVRWWVLLRIQRIRIPLFEAVRLGFLGQFFNYIVPGTVGGDLVKSYYVAKHTNLKAAVLVSVFVDRLLGFAELTFLATVMILGVLVSGVKSFADMRDPVIAAASVVVLLVGMLTFLFSRRFRAALHLQKLYRRLPLAHYIEAAGDAAMLYRTRIRALGKAVAITFGSHALFVGSVALMGASLSLDVPWYSYLIYVPLIYIVGAIPVTPGGVGLVEGLFLAFFGASCDAGKIVALAMLARFIPMLWGIPGAVVAITGPKLPKVKELEAQLGLGPDGGPIGDDPPCRQDTP